MTILGILCTLWSALELDSIQPKPRWVPVRMGKSNLVALVSQVKAQAKTMHVADSKILVKRAPGNSEDFLFEDDTLDGPVVLARTSNGKWRIPDGSVVHVHDGWSSGEEHVYPPLVLAGDSLCRWQPARYPKLVTGESADWDSVCFEVKGYLLRAHLRTRWIERHPEYAMRIERDSGHRMRGPNFVDAPDRIVLEPTSRKHYDFSWLDDSGRPIHQERAIPWRTDTLQPCTPARAGSLELGIRIHSNPAFSTTSWVAPVGTNDTLITTRSLIQGSYTKVGWRLPPTTHPLPEGWSVHADTLQLERELGSSSMEYMEAPSTLRWCHGDRTWLPEFDHHSRARLVLDSTPPHQDRNVIWSVVPTPLSAAPFQIRGFGWARWTGRFRWSSDDSLVAWANLALTGIARRTLGRDSLAIELPVRWNPGNPTQEFDPDTSAGFRTLPMTSLKWNKGRIESTQDYFLLVADTNGIQLALPSPARNPVHKDEDPPKRQARHESEELVWMGPNTPARRIIDPHIGPDFRLQLGDVASRPLRTLIMDYVPPPRW